MGFDTAGDFLLNVAKKYKLHKQAAGALVRERARKVFARECPEHADGWEPLKYEHGILTVQASGSAAASELFLRTHELMEKINQEDLPLTIKEIRIIRNRK